MHTLKIVSLFTREWIEIDLLGVSRQTATKSPSLRGSGLKCEHGAVFMKSEGLPLYEGVD